MTRALDLLEPGDPRHPPLLFDLLSVLVHVGELERAQALLADAPDDPRLLIVRCELLTATEPNEMVRLAEEALPALIERLEAQGDHATLAKAHMALFNAYWMRSNAGRAAEARAAAVEHARAAGDHGLLTEALMWQAGPLIYGPAGRDAIARWADEAEAEASGPLQAGAVAMARSYVALMDGDFDEARRQVLLTADAFGEVGFELLRSATGQPLAEVELAAGDAAAAVRAARESYDYGGRMGDTSYRPTTGAWLAMALLADGRLDEAEAMALEVEEMSADVDIINFSMTRGVRAQVAAARGDAERAEALAREGVEFALATDFLLMQGHAYEALHAVTGDEEARERARACFEIKGYKPGLQAYS